MHGDCHTAPALRKCMRQITVWTEKKLDMLLDIVVFIFRSKGFITFNPRIVIKIKKEKLPHLHSKDVYLNTNQFQEKLPSLQRPPLAASVYELLAICSFDHMTQRPPFNVNQFQHLEQWSCHHGNLSIDSFVTSLWHWSLMQLWTNNLFIKMGWSCISSFIQLQTDCNPKTVLGHCTRLCTCFFHDT